MNERETFKKVMNSMDVATNTTDNALGGLVILSGVFTEFSLSEIILAEADKVQSTIFNNQATVSELTDLDNSVANVLEQICCIEEQVNRKIAQGRAIRKGE